MSPRRTTHRHLLSSASIAAETASVLPKLASAGIITSARPSIGWISQTEKGVTRAPIYVDFEYGDLKEVIVGRGVMLYPDVERAAWARQTAVERAKSRTGVR